MSNSSLRNAAIVLLSLPEGEAALLLNRLDPEQTERVVAEMASLRRLRDADREQSLRLFAEGSTAEDVVELRGFDAAQRIVREALGERAPAILAGVRRRLADNTRSAFERLDDATWSKVLAAERPQIAAWLLAHLPVQRAARYLHTRPDDEQLALVARIAELQPTGIEVLRAIAAGLELAAQPRVESATAESPLAPLTAAEAPAPPSYGRQSAA